MDWTVEQKKFVHTILKKFGDRISPQHLSFLLKRHLGTSVSLQDISELVKESDAVSPQASLKELPLQKRSKDMKGVCIEIINEAKQILQKDGLHKTTGTLDPCGLSAFLFLSDLHFGEIVEVNGAEVFNSQIANERLTNIVDQFIYARELDAYTVDECIVLLGGDIIDGELIYPAQSFDVEGHAYNQIRSATTFIWAAILKLAERFPVVKVYCVPGNHGRASKLHHQMSNWDNVLYYGIQLLANTSKTNIEVHTPSQMWMDFNVRTWRVHTRHIGVVQPITGGPAKKVMTWLDNHNADLFFYGHFHSPEMYSMGHRRVFKNGALPPANDFAENLGFLDGSGQWMIGITDFDSVAFAKIIVPE